MLLLIFVFVLLFFYLEIKQTAVIGVILINTLYQLSGEQMLYTLLFIHFLTTENYVSNDDLVS